MKDNRPRGNTNMQYIDDKMKLDHFWDEDATKDGYHKQVDMPNLAVDPIALPSVGVNGQIYVRQKTALETSSTQLTEPFFASLDGATLKFAQLLGIRACAVFDASGTIVYKQNVTSVVNNSPGFYTVNFTNTLPTVNYLVLGAGIRSSAAELLFSMVGNASLASVKTTSFVKIKFQSDGGTGHNPLQGWVVCFGG